MEPTRLDTDGLPFGSSRKFQLWGYGVSHGQLLLRSNKAPDSPTTRLEILFKDARFVCLPSVMDGLTVRRGDDEIVDRNMSDFGPLELEHGVSIFAVGGQGWKGFVVAGAVWTLEDDAEYFAASKLAPDIGAFGESP